MRKFQELEERPFKSGVAQTLADRVFSYNSRCNFSTTSEPSGRAIFRIVLAKKLAEHHETSPEHVGLSSKVPHRCAAASDRMSESRPSAARRRSFTYFFP